MLVEQFRELRYFALQDSSIPLILRRAFGGLSDERLSGFLINLGASKTRLPTYPVFRIILLPRLCMSVEHTFQHLLE